MPRKPDRRVFVSVDWLTAHLDDGNLRIIDARYVYPNESPQGDEMYAAGHIPGGTRRNLEDLEDRVDFGDKDETTRLILADAQTSGGLLISVPEEHAEELMELLQSAAPIAAIIGRVTDGAPGTIRVL